MRVAVLFSGGKDSVFAVFWVLMHGFDPILVTVRPPEYSMMFHHPNIDSTKKQAETMGIEQVFVDADEQNWRDVLLKTFKELGVDGIVTGAVASEYQRRRIDSIGEELSIPTYSPLWHKDKGDEVLNELLVYFDIWVSAVSAEGLGPNLLGLRFRDVVDHVHKKNLDVHPFLEGGEGETFVLSAPFFNKKLAVKKYNTEWDGVRGVARIEKLIFSD